MAENPFLQTDRQVVGDIYTSDELQENLGVLCDQLGSRFAGSDQERQAADFMKAKLEAYGLPKVWLEPVEYQGWVRGTAELQVTSPVEKSIPCITLPHSPASDLKGQIIDMGDGAPDDFEKRADEIAGKIVLTNSVVFPKGGRRWIHRQEKYGRALMAGAIGFIFVNHYPGYGPATGGIGPDRPQSGEAIIPGISLSMEDGAYLQRLIRRHGHVSVHLHTSDVSKPVTSWNVLADLPGQRDPDIIVMMGCHYDGHDISQGAADPASGTVALLEAARVLAKYAPNLPYTVRFALWAAEEIGLIGSTQYVMRHEDELDQIRFYLNMDMAGALDPKDIILNEWDALENLLEEWRDGMVLEFGVGQSVSAHSDHFPFMGAGVPTGGIGSLDGHSSGRGYGHTMYDTVDKVELRGMREAAALAARLALRMASIDRWPVARRSREAVTEVLDSPEHREMMEFFASVNAYYEQNGEDE